jgi:hypothetical protein
VGDKTMLAALTAVACVKMSQAAKLGRARCSGGIVFGRCRMKMWSRGSTATEAMWPATSS